VTVRALTSGIGLAASLALACASGALSPNHCEVKVVGVEKREVHARGADVAYRVRGKAGSRGVVSLAARTASGEYIAGDGVDVGPGPFEAIVEQELTGLPAGFVVLLEVPGKRCKADVKS
jgi:hypothetical protein